jgi:hypothetical protein
MLNNQARERNEGWGGSFASLCFRFSNALRCEELRQPRTSLPLQRDPQQAGFRGDRPGHCAAVAAAEMHAIPYQAKSQCSHALEQPGLETGRETKFN